MVQFAMKGKRKKER
uniref:Uncharacterized protein n=1 Tax=Anguilla anguilla TaxID=7936 RepID=A0A0E9V9A3_ANGAN